MRREEKHSPAIAKALDDFYKSDKRIRGLSSDEETNSEKLRDILSEKVKEDIVDIVRKNSEFIKNIDIHRKSPINENEEKLGINHFSTYSRVFYNNFIGLPNLEHFFEETKDAVNCIDTLVRKIEFLERHDPHEVILNNIFSCLVANLKSTFCIFSDEISTFIKTIGLICRKIVILQHNKDLLKIGGVYVAYEGLDVFGILFCNCTIEFIKTYKYSEIEYIISRIFDVFSLKKDNVYLFEDYFKPLTNHFSILNDQYQNQMANLVEYHENKEY